MTMTALTLALGLAILLAGAEILVRGASRLALAAGLSPLVTGLTVVAFGTSAPELAVSVGAGLDGRFALAAGNALGSNIFNVLAVLGITALIAPLDVERRLVRLDVPVMIGGSVGSWLALADGRLDTWEALVLLGGMGVYTAALLLRSGPAKTQDLRPDIDLPRRTVAPPRAPLPLMLSAGAVAAGVAMLSWGADMFVGAAVEIATTMGVSEALVGATVAAAGTSLPELATSALAAVRGERDMAVGNVVGSNLFNVLVALPVAGLVTSGTAALAPQSQFDLPVMAMAAFLCLPVFLTGSRITRAEGLLFVDIFACYLAARIAIDLDLPWGAAVEQNALPIILGVTGIVYVMSLSRSSMRLTRLAAGAGQAVMRDARRAVRKAAVLVAGTAVLLAGLVMLVTPGPGIAAIVLGLVILATEFMWAKTLLTKAKKRFSDVAGHVRTNGLKSLRRNKR